MRKLLSFCILIFAFTVGAGCTRDPSMLLNLAGPNAKTVAHLFWYFFIVETIIFIGVLGLLFYFLWRRRVSTLEKAEKPSVQTEKRLGRYVGGGIIGTVLILTSFVITSYIVDHEHAAFAKDAPIEIEVTAHQWWWEVRYMSSTPSNIFTTANEIHIPVGKKVRLILQSNDVIHSMWIPNLAGKQDIIPGRDQDLYIQADEPGVWFGRCAEFCGLQHANMEFHVVSESETAFENWKATQLLPAEEPKTSEAKRGKDIFTKGACAMCHQIRGTDAFYSSNAPDLTHLMGRATIGAGAARNVKGFLAGWIIDPHGIKPGVHMPTILQEPKDFRALLAYLETLK